jgi:hypothetical protein
VACEERTSIDWARVIRGIASMLNEVTRFAASAWTRSVLVTGESRAISVEPSRSSATSSCPVAGSVCGRWTLTTMSDCR